LKILVSSRQALGISGESNYHVPSLSLPEPNTSYTPENLAKFEAVRLFTERATAVKPDFTITIQNNSALSCICQRLDGIPLAIELAAARVRSLPVDEINNRLDQCFRLLTGGSRTALPRQQTLRALIDWSYDLLNESEKALLCRLSVFSGGWSIDAAEMVCASDGIEDSDVLDLLLSLVDKSLVVSGDRAGKARFCLLETMRQFGRDRLQDRGERVAVFDRHLNYFMSLAEDTVPKLAGPEQAEWLQHLEVEHENLRRALDRSLAESGSAAAIRLCAALWRFWEVRGHLFEGRRWCERALETAGSQEMTRGRAEVLNGAGNLCYRQGDYDSGRIFHEESLAIWREIGDQTGIASSLNNLGLVAIVQGDYDSGRIYYEESLTIKRKAGDRRGISGSLNNLGNIAHDQGDYGSAIAFHKESLEIRREYGDRSGIGTSLNNLGNVAYNQGDYASAKEYYSESMSVRREIGNRGGIAMSLNNLGSVAIAQGDYASARISIADGLSIRVEIGSRNAIAESLESFASLASKEHRWGLATKLWATAEALREQIGAPLPLNQRDEHLRNLSCARQSLGEEAFYTAWKMGRNMSMEQAIELALSQPNEQ
jgi:non-specific serine/threonine protein kinase